MAIQKTRLINLSAGSKKRSKSVYKSKAAEYVNSMEKIADVLAEQLGDLSDIIVSLVTDYASEATGIDVQKHINDGDEAGLSDYLFDIHVRILETVFDSKGFRSWFFGNAFDLTKSVMAELNKFKKDIAKTIRRYLVEAGAEIDYNEDIDG